MAEETDIPKREGRACLRSRRFYVGMLLLGLFLYYFCPGWIHAGYVLQREKRSTLYVPPDVRSQIVSGDPAAVLWLEGRIEAGAGSIPALLLLQSMAGETFGQVPNLCQGCSFCGNTGRRTTWRLMNRGFRTMRKQEGEAFAEYRRRKDSLCFDRLRNVDLHSEESVRACFRQGWDQLDGGRIYLLLSRESQGEGFFRQTMRYLEWLEERKGLSYRMTSTSSAPGARDYVEIYSQADSSDAPKGHGVHFTVFRNNQTQQYEIDL